MSQKSPLDGGGGAHKHFAVGRGLLAAVETLNFTMTEQQQQLGRSSGSGGGADGPDGGGGGQMSRRGGGGGHNLGSTMKLFASLGLSPSDLDALAEVPEEQISVETLPQIIMQLKSRKGDGAGERRAAAADAAMMYRGGRDAWDHRMGASSLGSARAQSNSSSSADFGFGSSSSSSSGRSYGFNYGGGGGGRERPYSELSRHDSSSFSSAPPLSSSSDGAFVPRRRGGSPSNGKVQDFLGSLPSMFPHVCSLCDFDVHSTAEWKQHVNGLRHAENRRVLLDMYPEWDPSVSSSRGLPPLDPPNLSAGLLGPAPSGRGGAGPSSSWGGSGASGMSDQNKLRSRVVVVKYVRKPLSNNTLFAFVEPFGRLREDLVLNNKAFLEMSCHEEALDVVNYYEQHPTSLYGKPLSFYLSRRLLFIQKEGRSSDMTMMERPAREVKGQQRSQVVFFSNLPREEEKKKELLTIAGRFGSVEKHLFLTGQAFVQLGAPQDAEMLVKYYSMNPLTVGGRRVRLNICTKYKTLHVNRKQADGRAQRSDRLNSSSGSRTSSRTSAPSREEEEEEEEEVSGVMEGEEPEEGAGPVEGEVPGEGAEPVTHGDTKIEKEQEEESSGDVKDEQVPHEVTDEVTNEVTEDTPEPVGGAECAEPTDRATESTEPETREEDQIKEEVMEEEEGAEPTDDQLDQDLEQDLDQDFMENMEDFVTLDEVVEDEEEEEEFRESDTTDYSRKGGMRVVNIVGFRRGYNFLQELLALAEPFGTVVKHLVLDLRMEAYLQLNSEDEARSMVKFYSGGNVTATVCGRPVRISHSMSYPTIQCGTSRVVYIGQMPGGSFSDESVLKLAEPFGTVCKFFVNRLKRESFIEMDRAEDAEKMADHCKRCPPKLHGKRLTVYVSRKYRQLKHGHRCVRTMKRESSRSRSDSAPEEPPAKKTREGAESQEGAESREEAKDTEESNETEEAAGKETKEEMEEAAEKTEEVVEKETKETEETKEMEEIKDTEEIKETEETKEINDTEEIKETEEGRSSASTNPEASDPKLKTGDLQEDKVDQGADQVETSTCPLTPEPRPQTSEPCPPAVNKPSVTSLPLPPYGPDTPIGVDQVKSGFYCRVCFLFYSNEETAKKTHCSSRAHYDKLQKHLEKEQTKAEKKKTS